MIVAAVLVLAAATLAPPDDAPTFGRPPPRPATAPAASVSVRHRIAGRRSLPRPDLSRAADPFRSDPIGLTRGGDPQHPSLAPVVDGAAEAGAGGLHLSPVPPDPWAPTVQPLAPPGGIRPPGPEG